MQQCFPFMLSDEESVEVELSAVAKNLEKMEDECIAKPETYEDKMARRQAETAGLKEALIALESGTSPAALFVAPSITRCALDLKLACSGLVDKTMKLSRMMAWYNDYVSHECSCISVWVCVDVLCVAHWHKLD